MRVIATPILETEPTVCRSQMVIKRLVSHSYLAVGAEFCRYRLPMCYGDPLRLGTK